MNYFQYQKEVTKKAFAEYKQPVCIDTIRDSYLKNEPIEKAVDRIIMESTYWDKGFG